MAEVTQQIYFKCPKCSAELLWNARVAGHKVSCPCGHIFVAPMRAAVTGADLPEPAPARESPKRDQQLTDLWMRPRKRVVEDDDDEDKSGPIRSWVIPSILIALGIIIALTQVTWEQKRYPKKVDLSFSQVTMILIALTVTLFAAVALAAHLFKLDFGRIKPAVYKTLSIPIFAGALAIAVARFDKDPEWITGLSMGWSVLILMYWMLFSF